MIVRDVYRIVRPIGAGGMGVVFLAMHEGLRREVALKLHRADAGLIGRERTMREAQTMARLSHPNVVLVYDVGEVEEGVFIAMEYVEGSTAKAVSTGAGVRWQDVLRTYLSAGRGLAAAHDVGLVHRDFKPDNVLVGRDGRVRVADFGIARAAWETLDPQQSALGLRVADVALTATGALVGTPAYMAPEQFGSGPVDARADQYAFCVALWEGLYGKRPFAGANPGEIYTAIRERRLQRPSATNVPGWIQLALERGLAFEPAQRWSSMLELLEHLEGVDARVPAHRAGPRTWALVTALVVAVAVVGAGGGMYAALRPVDEDADASVRRASESIKSGAGETARPESPLPPEGEPPGVGDPELGSIVRAALAAKPPGDGDSSRGAPFDGSKGLVVTSDSASDPETVDEGTPPEPPISRGQYKCGVDASYELRGKTIRLVEGAAEKEAFWVAGECTLRLIDCTIVAPTGLWVGGNASLVVEGGTIELSDKGIDVGGYGRVEVTGTKIHATKRGRQTGEASSWGVNVSGYGSATLTDVTIDADIAAEVGGYGALVLRQGSLTGRVWALVARTSPEKLVVDGTALNGGIDVSDDLRAALK